MLSGDDSVRTYCYRFANLGVIAMLNFAFGFLWIAFAPVANLAAEYYGVSEVAINLLSGVYMLFSFILLLPASWALDTRGLSNPMRVAAVLGLIGVAIRWYPGGDSHSFAWLFIGQSFTAAGQPFVLAAPAKMSAVWFPDAERTIASSVGSLSNAFAVAVGFAVAPVAVERPSDVPFYLLLQFIAFGVIFVVSFVFIRAEPPSPPSRSAAEDRDGFVAGLKRAFRIPSFVGIVMVFGIGYGISSAVLTLLNQFLVPEGYSPVDVGWIGAILITSGIIGSCVFGPLSDRYPRKKKALLAVGFLGSTVGCLLFTVFLQRGKFPLLCAFMAFTGFFAMMIMPLSFEYACDVVYPVGEATPTGTLMLSGVLIGLTLLLSLGALHDETHDAKLPMGIMTGLLAVALVWTLFLKEDYRRVDAEQRQKAAAQSSEEKRPNAGNE